MMAKWFVVVIPSMLDFAYPLFNLAHFARFLQRVMRGCVQPKQGCHERGRGRGAHRRSRGGVHGGADRVSSGEEVVRHGEVERWMGVHRQRRGGVAA